MVLAALLALLAGAGGLPAADARSATVKDPARNPAYADVRSARYADRENQVVTRVKVRDLGSSGSLLVRIGPQNADVMYYATLTRSAAGVLTRKLEYVTLGGRDTVACAFSGRWSRRTDTVRVAVPHTCLDFGVFLSKHWVEATLRAGRFVDAAPSRNLGRGDSPGCVTRTEFRRVTRGQLLSRVHAALDTAGRFGDGAGGGYSRVYAKCAGTGRYAIEYDGQTTRVASKVRIR